MNILITGSKGFVGSNIFNLLSREGFQIFDGSLSKTFSENNNRITVNSNFDELLEGIDVVIHLAAKVHIMDTNASNATNYELENTEITRLLGEAAIKANIKKFIFLSTIKVNGESTNLDSSFNEADVPNPTDRYSNSKYMAEEEIKRVFMDSQSSLIIIRPPLIYGPRVKGNFRNLIKIANLNFPLPLGSIKNKRSLLSVYNLSDFIKAVLLFEDKLNETFILSDGDDVSTPEIIKAVAHSNNRTALIFPFPKAIIFLLATLLGKKNYYHRITENLRVDISKSIRILGWHPPYNFSDSIKMTFNDEI